MNVFNDRFELVGERTLKLVGHELNRNEESQGIAFSPNEEWAVTWSGREARLWDLSAPRPGAGREPQILSEDRLPDIGFQPAERWQVRAGDGRRPEVGRSEDELRECDANGPVHEGDVKVAVLSPDGGFLFTAGTKDSGRLWSLDAGGSCSFRSFGFVDPAAAAAFGAGERWLVIGSSEGRVFLSDPRVRELRASARRLHPAAGRATVRVLALSDDARWLFAATDPGEARLWELEDGRSLYSVTFPELEPIRAATFPPDGRHLATEHDNGVVRRWRLLRDEASREELIDLACRAAGRNLTCEEWRDAFGTGEPYRRTCPDLYGPARPCDARREEPACGAVSMP